MKKNLSLIILFLIITFPVHSEDKLNSLKNFDLNDNI